MKKIVVCIVLLLSVLSVNAQSVDKFMSNLSKEQNVDNVKIGGFMLALMKPFVAIKAGEVMPIVNGIKSIHILNVDNCDENKKAEYLTHINNMQDSDGYATILRVKDGDDNVRIMIKKEKDKIKELYVFNVGKNEVSVVNLKGNIKDKDIQKLVAQHDK